MPVYPVGMHLVAEAVKSSGHQVAIVDMFEYQDPWTVLESKIAQFRPDVVGVSIRNIDDQSRENTQFFLEGSREVIRRLRSLTVAPIVLGGAGYSIFPESGLAYLEADMGLAGDGEAILPALLQAMDGLCGYDQVPGLYRPGIGRVGPVQAAADLDLCPLPRPESLSLTRVQSSDFWMPYQTRRGCPLDCSYCSTGSIEGRIIRQRSVSTVVANLQKFQEAGVQRIFFVDNTFNLPQRYAKTLCQSMIHAGLTLNWCAIVYPKHLGGELADLMNQSGCSQVSLGFESGSPKMLSALNKRFSAPEVREVSDRLATAGIRRMGFLLLGGPGETKETVEQSLDFAESLDLEALKITVGIRIYPGTRLAREAERDGLIHQGESLLQPRFYLAPALKEWLPQRIQDWSSKHQELITS
jgi:radical SAM superfamily enzyme YgiQ (UPF0313 family)